MFCGQSMENLNSDTKTLVYDPNVFDQIMGDHRWICRQSWRSQTIKCDIKHVLVRSSNFMEPEKSTNIGNKQSCNVVS